MTKHKIRRRDFLGRSWLPVPLPPRPVGCIGRLQKPATPLNTGC